MSGAALPGSNEAARAAAVNGHVLHGRSPWMAFYLIADALAHRNKHGGWVFLPDGGFHPVWFNTEYTPTAIMNHPLTAGRSGKLLP